MQLELVHRQPETLASATPILFVHGAWHAAWCWDEYFLPYFAQHGYASYALSLRGHGSSQGKERLRWWRIADYVADVAQVVVGGGRGSTHAAAHDRGNRPDLRHASAGLPRDGP